MVAIGSILEFISQIGIGMFIGGLITIPIVLLWWKFKERKIKKNVPKDMPEQINKFREDERRLEDERSKDAREFRRTNELVEQYKRNKYLGVGKSEFEESALSSTGGGSIERLGEIPTTETDSVKRSKPSTKKHRKGSKHDLPSFA